MLQMPRTPRGKSALSPPRAKSAPRRSKSTTFAKGIFQFFNLQQIAMNPIGDPSVLPIQYPIYLWLQAAAWEAFRIGGWCVVSCMSIQIMFQLVCIGADFEIYGSTIGVWNFHEIDDDHDDHEHDHDHDDHDDDYNDDDDDNDDHDEIRDKLKFTVPP